MDIEIVVSGPDQAVFALCSMLRSLNPLLEHERNGIMKMSVYSEPGTLDDDLTVISGLAGEVEKTFDLTEKLDFRVRNLAFCEPPPSGRQVSCQPVPELIIRPDGPVARQQKHPGTIILDAEQAFGSGRHPTTILCLKALSGLALNWSRFRESRVLDFGCGTGLLAIAALKLGAPRAVGVDIDDNAIQEAEKNRVINSLTHRFRVIQGSWEKLHEKYDLILLNLVSSLLLRAGRMIPAHLREKGRVVISGFSAQQTEIMQDFFIPMGFETLEKMTREGWGCLVFKKSGSDPPC